MKTLRYCPLLFLFALLVSCGGDDSVELTPPPAAGLELIMDGERAWRVAAVDSDKPLDFDGVVTTDWYAQMEPCLNDDPIVITYEARSEQVAPDVLNLEVYAGQGLKCSEFEMPREHSVLGHSLEPLKRYELSPVSVIHKQLYGFPTFEDSLEEIWEDPTFSADSITYSVTKLIDGIEYRVQVKLVPMP